MHKTEAQGNTGSKPAVPAAVNSPGYFQSGTVVDYGFLNSVMDEIAGAIEASGLTLDRDEDGQLFAAMQAGMLSDTVDIFQASSSTLHTRAIAVSEKSTAEGDFTFVAASTYANAVGNHVAILATELVSGDTGVSGNMSALLGCGGDGTTDISADNAVGIATFNPDIGSDFGSIIGGGNNEIGANAGSSSIIVSTDSKVRSANGGTTPNNIALLASSFCDFDLGATGTAQRRYAVAGGYHLTTLSAPSWRIESNGGTMRSTAAHTTSGLDYAEMFENRDQEPHPPGSFLSRAGRKAKLGQAGDRVLGVVSVNPTVVGGDDGLAWHGRFIRDDWGAIVQEEVVDGNDLVTQPKLNPTYDVSRPQMTRRDRPSEWTCVGLVGQMRCRVDASVEEGDLVGCGDNGIGTSVPVANGRPVECMEILSPFDPARGYAIALCLVG